MTEVEVYRDERGFLVYREPCGPPGEYLEDAPDFIDDGSTWKCGDCGRRWKKGVTLCSCWIPTQGDIAEWEQRMGRKMNLDPSDSRATGATAKGASE